MKTTFLNKILLVICIITIGNSVFGQNTGFVKLEGDKFTLNGEPFYPIAANYVVRINKSNVSGSTVWNVAPDFWSLGLGKMHYGVPPNDFCCYQAQGDNFSAATQQLMIVEDFKILIDKGFNSIRLCGIGIGEQLITTHEACTDSPDNSKKYKEYGHELGFHYWNRTTYNSNDFLSIRDPSGDPLNNIYFPMLQIIFDAANVAAQEMGKPFRVMLLVGDKNVDQGDQPGDVGLNRRNEFTNFLGVIADHFKDETALMAYDFYNEPYYYTGVVEESIVCKANEPPIIVETDNTSYSKQEVCGIVEAWHNAVHTNTDNQLTTIGLHGCWDAFEWDPTMLKVDFLSFHIYPAHTNVNHTSSHFDKIMADTKRYLKWIGNTVKRPWIVGEIGLSSSYNTDIDCEDYAFHDQQSDFVELTLDFTRDVGGLGYTWWTYKEAIGYKFHNDPFYFVDPNNLMDPDYPCCNDDVDLPDQYMSLWTAGIPKDFACSAATTPIYSCTESIEKDAVVKFGLFDPFTIDPNGGNLLYDDYFNPYGYTASISGYVFDQNFEPVNNAVITKGENIDGGLNYITYSIPDGSFILYYDPAHPLSGDFSVSASTANVVSAFIYSEQKYYFFLDKTADDLNISQTITGAQNFEAVNRIFAQNTTIVGNGTSGADCEMKAVQSITLNTGFSAQKGCHFLAELGPVDCGSLPDTKSPMVNETPKYDRHETVTHYSGINSKDSIIVKPELTFAVKPNPNEGIFSIVSNDLKHLKKSVFIYNNLGTLILSKETDEKEVQINMESYGTGLYSVIIDCENTRYTMKLVIQ